MTQQFQPPHLSSRNALCLVATYYPSVWGKPSQQLSSYAVCARRVVDGILAL